MSKLHHLNNQFGITDHLQFEMIDEHIVISINNEHATAKISLYGGQVLSFVPHGETEDVLFVSEHALYQAGKAIRGGIPICWPWFGDDKSGFGRPSHGFARNQSWEVLDCQQCTDGSTTIILSLSDSDDSLAVWPHPFQLLMTVNIGKTLTVTLTTKNTGTKPLPLTQALHTYFKISDVKHVKVTGLDGNNYLDKLTDFTRHTQSGDVLIDKEVDRIYQGVTNKVTLHDAGFKRDIEISATGSHTTVVWNPWSTTIKNIDDLKPESYQQFVCVETVNTADDSKMIAAQGEHSMTAEYTVIRHS